MSWLSTARYDSPTSRQSHCLMMMKLLKESVPRVAYCCSTLSERLAPKYVCMTRESPNERMSRPIL